MKLDANPDPVSPTPRPPAGPPQVVVLEADTTAMAAQVVRAIVQRSGGAWQAVAAVHCALSPAAVAIRRLGAAVSEARVGDPGALHAVLRGASTVVWLPAETPQMAEEAENIATAAQIRFCLRY